MDFKGKNSKNKHQMTNKSEIRMTEIRNDLRFEHLDFVFRICLSFENCNLNIITK
jgi:hypothetical protein